MSYYEIAVLIVFIIIWGVSAVLCFAVTSYFTGNKKPLRKIGDILDSIFYPNESTNALNNKSYQGNTNDANNNNCRSCLKPCNSGDKKQEFIHKDFYANSDAKNINETSNPITSGMFGELVNAEYETSKGQQKHNQVKPGAIHNCNKGNKYEQKIIKVSLI